MLWFCGRWHAQGSRAKIRPTAGRALDAAHAKGLAYPSGRVKVLGREGRRMGHLQKSEHAFQVIVAQDQAGWYLAECPALKDCAAQGQTYEEALQNMKAA